MKQLPKTAFVLITVLSVFLSDPAMAGDTSGLPQQTDSISREKTAAEWFIEAKTPDKTPAEACMAYGHGLRLEPDNTEMILALAKACRAAANPGEALDRLLPLLTTRPSVTAYTSAVGLLTDYGATRDAATIARQGAAQYPEAIELSILAAALLVPTDPAGAVEIIDSALRRHGENAELLTLLGRCREQTRQWAQAYTAYSKALARDPTAKNAATGRARTLNHALVNGDTVLFPTGNQWLMDNQLIDRQTGEAVLLLKVSATTPAEAARQFILEIFPGAGSDNTPLIERIPAEHPGAAFALAGIATPELVENKIRYTIRSVAYALAFSSGNNQFILGVRQSNRNPAEALAFVTELLAGIIPPT